MDGAMKITTTETTVPTDGTPDETIHEASPQEASLQGASAGDGREPTLEGRLAAHIPHLRRHARALTGNQATGDAYAVAALDALAAEPGELSRASSPRVALFKAFHSLWMSTGAPAEVDPSEPASGSETAGAARPEASLAPYSREALVLHSIERMSVPEVAEVMGVSEGEARSRIEIAREQLATAQRGNVLIIEDEAIIAMDLEGIVRESGHEVTGIARTREGAVRLGLDRRPDLILADVQLADASSGIDAVHDLMEQFGDIPVLFITAFPERLLTGTQPEPAFLIAKPFGEDQVRLAIVQALARGRAAEAA